MTQLDRIELMLLKIIDHLGIDKNQVQARKQVEDRATADVLKFRTKRIKKGHVGERPGER